MTLKDLKAWKKLIRIKSICWIFFLRHEIFTGKHSEYKEVHNEYALFRKKIDDKKSSITTQQSNEQPDITDTPDLESEEFAAQRRNQQGQGLKILTLNQMLRRLPIPLAELKTGNNSEKLINKIRQLLYSLYRSKKLTKRIYKSLTDII